VTLLCVVSSDTMVCSDTIVLYVVPVDQHCPSDDDHEHAKVVPIVVGSVLGLLLVAIFAAYSVAYLRQRNNISKSYEPLNSS